MSTMSVSRLALPSEAAPVARRSSERTDSEQAFTLPPPPPERADGPRPRIDDARDSREKNATTRDNTGSEKKEVAGRGEAAAETRPAETAQRADDKQGETATGEKAASQGSQQKAGDSDGSANQTAPQQGGTSLEERKAVLAAALKNAPIIGEGTPETAAAAGAAMQPPVPPAIGAEFLALAAIAVQGGEPAKPEAATDKKGAVDPATGEATAVAETATAETATAQAAAGVVPVPVPVQLAVPAKADGKASAGGEAAAVDSKTGFKPQLAAAGATGAQPQGEEGKAKDGEDTAEAGAASATATPAGESKATTQTGAAGQADQATAADETAPAAAPAAAPASGTPLTPQAILAAGPLAPGKAETPLPPLDAAAQANAQAQSEANAKASVELTRPTPLHVVPVEIGARALAGNKRFDIRLDPAELGRVDVRLEISDDGGVTAKLTVDRVETLQLLQRDAKTLERAFEQAGLKPSEGGVEMSLRDQSDQGSRQSRQDDESSRMRRAWVETIEDGALIAETAPLRRAARLGGVDLSV